MSLSTLVRTNLIISIRETVNAVVSYIFHALFSLLFVGLILLPIFVNDKSIFVPILIAFVLMLSFYDYLFIQVKLKGTSLVDKSALSIFPVSHARSLSIRFLLFLFDKRILFYLLPMIGMIVVFAARNRFLEAFPIFFLFVSFYLVISEIAFLFYFLLRKLADKFSVRTATQIAIIPIVLLTLFVNAIHHKTTMLIKAPVMSQFIRGYQEIFASHLGPALIEGATLFGIFVLIAIITSGASFVYQKITDRFRFHLTLPTYKIIGQKTRIQNANPPGDRKTVGYSLKHVSDIDETLASVPFSQATQTGWHIVFTDWLIHQREEKILFLILLYPLLIIFSIIKITSRIHFDPGSLILPIFFLTQMLGFYFADNHFTGHGLRLSHIALTPFEPYKFVFAKTVSTWGLLSLMNTFVCLFCGVYLNMAFQILLRGTIYSLFLPLVLVQLENTLNLYFPRISMHPLISLLIIICSELVLTAIYVLMMLFNVVLGIIFVAVVFYFSLSLSLPAWGKQLSSQLPVLLEVQK